MSRCHYCGCPEPLDGFDSIWVLSLGRWVPVCFPCVPREAK